MHTENDVFGIILVTIEVVLITAGAMWIASRPTVAVGRIRLTRRECVVVRATARHHASRSMRLTRRVR